MTNIKKLFSSNLIKRFYSNDFTNTEIKINKTIFAVLSNPKILEKNFPTKHHIIASIHLNEINDNYNYNSTCDYLSLFNIRQVVLMTITKDPMITEITKRTYLNEEGNTCIIEILIPTFYFWTISFLKYTIFYKYKENLSNNIPHNIMNEIIEEIKKSNFIIYKFDDTTWFEIISKFKSFNISISGGIHTKRHINSPLIVNLNTFLLCLEKDKLPIKTWNSFHNISNISSKIWTNYNLSLDKIQIFYNNLQKLYNKKLEEYNISKTIENHPLGIKNNLINLEELSVLLDSIKKVIESLELKEQNNQEKKISNKLSNGIQKREYHSTSRLYSIKISKPISNYLIKIKELINNENYTSEEAQLRIEETWLDLAKNFIEDKELINKNIGKHLTSIFKEAFKTLNIKNDKNTLKRKFKKYYLALNKMEILLITYVIAYSSINNSIGYTHLSDIIGQRIMQYIYLNEKIIIIKDDKNYINIENEFIKDHFTFTEFLEIISSDNMEKIKLGDFFFRNIY